MSEKNLCFICGNEPSADSVKCRNMSPFHSFCKGCFANYILSTGQQCKENQRPFDPENVKCPVPFCSTPFAKKFV